MLKKVPLASDSLIHGLYTDLTQVLVSYGGWIFFPAPLGSERTLAQWWVCPSLAISWGIRKSSFSSALRSCSLVYLILGQVCPVMKRTGTHYSLAMWYMVTPMNIHLNCSTEIVIVLRNLESSSTVEVPLPWTLSECLLRHIFIVALWSKKTIIHYVKSAVQTSRLTRMSSASVTARDLDRTSPGILEIRPRSVGLMNRHDLYKGTRFMHRKAGNNYDNHCYANDTRRNYGRCWSFVNGLPYCGYSWRIVRTQTWFFKSNVFWIVYQGNAFISELRRHGGSCYEWVVAPTRETTPSSIRKEKAWAILQYSSWRVELGRPIRLADSPPRLFSLESLLIVGYFETAGCQSILGKYQYADRYWIQVSDAILGRCILRSHSQISLSAHTSALWAYWHRSIYWFRLWSCQNGVSGLYWMWSRHRAEHTIKRW